MNFGEKNEFGEVVWILVGRKKMEKEGKESSPPRSSVLVVGSVGVSPLEI
ncbi:hypothetical protein RchiOBHm_Chr3g0495061 [Rosa chinensis]|uniref:Uncharacterized protein n=1 Tax=Rosa chinensis TaxID=74649 RepID=A0A2P6RH49_ROSCH|nr:hypothetical protein RchiOBHm_Chr3g0495061 [Rosa chinensis]